MGEFVNVGVPGCFVHCGSVSVVWGTVCGIFACCIVVACNWYLGLAAFVKIGSLLTMGVGGGRIVLMSCRNTSWHVSCFCIFVFCSSICLMFVLMPVFWFSKATTLFASCVILCVSVLPNAKICLPSPSISCEMTAIDSANNFSVVLSCVCGSAMACACSSSVCPG